MLGFLMRYAASRATEGAVTAVSRTVVWSALAFFLFGVGTIFALIVAFWFLDALLDPRAAGLLIVLFCFVAGLICLVAPRFFNQLDQARKPDAGAGAAVTETLAAAQEEVGDAVDYFGPIRVLGSAFMFGFGVARTLRR